MPFVEFICMPTFNWCTHDFGQTSVGMYAQLFSLIRINWDVTSRSSFLKK